MVRCTCCVFTMNLLSVIVIVLLCGYMPPCNAALRDRHCKYFVHRIYIYVCVYIPSCLPCCGINTVPVPGLSGFWHAGGVTSFINSTGPFISLSSHSPLNFHTTNGSSTTVYQIFITEGSASDLQISWNRSPYLLQPRSRYLIDSRVIDDRTLNASLIIWEAQLNPDQGNYTVTAANECTANSTEFYLHFSKCEATQLPKPFQRYNETIIIESPSPNVLHLSVVFHGPVDLTVSVTAWNFESIQCVETGCPPNMFRCNRTIINSSIFTADLWIYNASYASTGQYTVRAIPTVGLSPPNNASVNLCKY